LIIVARPARRGSSVGRRDAASSTGRNLVQVTAPPPFGEIMKFLINQFSLTKTENAFMIMAMTDWNADDAPVKLGGGERRDQLTARSMTNRNAAMQLQIERGIFLF
jgi:hypothetical protein